MHRLTTIAFSHYVEKARWALDRFGVPFHDRRFLPFVHVAAVYGVHRGEHGSGDKASSAYSTPVLETSSGEILCDSAAIVRYASDRFAPRGHDLHPSDEAAELEQHLHDRLGPHTRRAAYGACFEDTSLLRDIARYNVDRVQSSAFIATLPLAVRALRGALGVDEARVARSVERVRTEMDAISERLADDRPYLLGDRFTAADLAFACMAAPMLVPAEYSAWLPPPERMPARWRRLTYELRETPAGKHAMRMFREERHRVVAPQPSHEIRPSA